MICPMFYIDLTNCFNGNFDLRVFSLLDQIYLKADQLQDLLIPKKLLHSFFVNPNMKIKQNFNTSNKQKKIHQSKYETPPPCTSKSFRSKMFQKRATKPIPKIADKQITLHTPLYQKYLQSDFQLSNILQVPQIWGCVIPRIRKASTVKQNYLKRDIDSPSNLFRSYIKRKSKLVYGIPILKKISVQKFQHLTCPLKNPQEQPQFDVQQPEVSQFFTQIKEMAKTARQTSRFKDSEPTTARQKVKRYSEQEHEEIRSSKLFAPKPATSAYRSRFGQKLIGTQGFLKSQQMRRVSNKSAYSMSLQQLRESINWKRRFLDCLNQSVQDAKRKQFNRLN